MASSSAICMQSRPLFPPRTTRASRSRPVMTVDAQAKKSCLSNMWREIQGAGDWAGLVDPLHPLLREEIVRYGELVAACYNGFDLDPSSRRYLRCKHAKSRLLAEVGLGSAGYEVTKYVYATPDIRIGAGACCGRWIGYVAIAQEEEARRLGRRDVVVCFRGTVTKAEWAANLMSSLTPVNLDPHVPRPGVKVESGFLSLYTSEDSTCRFGEGSCREQLLREVGRLLHEHSCEEVSVTVAGHSMGSALAVLLGYDLAELGLGRGAPVTVCSFGGPRVGNTGFKRRVEELGVKVLRVANVRDPVTKLPGLFLNEGHSAERPWSCACYAHVGVELALDFFEASNPACVHDLEAYVGLLRCPKPNVAGKQGVSLLAAARNLVSKRRLEAWAWQDVAMRVGNLAQSLRLIGEDCPSMSFSFYFRIRTGQWLLHLTCILIPERLS